MLRQARRLQDLELRARDGRIGHVSDLFFDDRRWTIRYFVVDTGTWLDHREVLIAPASVHQPDGEARFLPVDLTQEQVRTSPGVDPDEPLSREQEIALIQYYNWPMYWGASGFNDPLVYTPPPYLPGASASRAARGHSALDEHHHVRSIDDVRGHRLEASDGELGHVDDFLIDDVSWEIAYMVVDTRNWWPGKRVLIAPDWIFEVGWDEAKVFVDLSRETIKHSPPYHPEETVTADYVTRLHGYYGLPHRNAEP